MSPKAKLVVCPAKELAMGMLVDVRQPGEKMRDVLHWTFSEAVGCQRAVLRWCSIIVVELLLLPQILLVDKMPEMLSSVVSLRMSGHPRLSHEAKPRNT